MNYEKISPKTIKHLYSAYMSVSESPLDAKIRRLVELRTSQINDCVYCCKLHSKDALNAGVSQEKIDSLSDWGNTNYFTENEKLALSWCEAVTLNSEEKNTLKERLPNYFNEREIVDLTACISIMNALNRIAINLRNFQ